MSSEVSVFEPTQLIGEAEIKVLRESLFRGFTDAEVNYSLAICKQLQLNPLLRQIHFVKRTLKTGPVITAQTGIDGFRLTAQRTGTYAGSDEPVFEYGTDKKRPVKATVTVYKMMAGQRCPFTASARWDEYYQSQGGMWDKMPHVMLGKCAETLALRKAFPAELSALRSDEEMAQANGPTKAETVQMRVVGDTKPAESAIETTARVEQIFTQETPQEPEDVDDDGPQGPPVCSRCNTQMRVSKSGLAWYCPNFQDKRNGLHDKFKV